MIHRRLSSLEVLCKLRILKSIILKRHPIVISLLLRFVRGLILFYFFCPVVWLFNDFKLHGWLGSAYTIQFYFTGEEANFLICVVVQPLNSNLMLLTSVFYHPYDYIRRFAGCIGYQLAQVIYVARDIRYLEKFMSGGYAIADKEISLYLAIITLYGQQKYMYDNKVHSVEHRIVSIPRPWLRPIVRGKVKAPVEFGAKFDLSLDSEGYGRIEKISFEAYNESTCLIEAVERFKDHTGYYPERVLADQIYRTRENKSYGKEHGIRLSGPKLGRPSAIA